MTEFVIRKVIVRDLFVVPCPEDVSNFMRHGVLIAILAHPSDGGSVKVVRAHIGGTTSIVGGPRRQQKGHVGCVQQRVLRACTRANANWCELYPAKLYRLFGSQYLYSTFTSG